ncbi:MAG: AzlC family ABC transporter permease, partial [Bdellovibrionaceae bacterium]|nr:AzlC family ABC transporter permease [Pseudobdellovibrionaceae bacterium]
MTSQLRVFLFGFRKTLPFQSGVIPFGLLYATLAGAVGFPWWITFMLSIVVFGGSSQLVFVDLMQTLASPLQATLGSNIVNAR